MKYPKTRADLDNHTNQLNPNHEKYRGPNDTDDHDYNNDNHRNQLDPNNEEYRGE